MLCAWRHVHVLLGTVPALQLPHRTGRQRGECAQPCRWSYYLMEEKRPGQYFPIFEDEHGSYILNAKDMSMIDISMTWWMPASPR